MAFEFPKTTRFNILHIRQVMFSGVFAFISQSGMQVSVDYQEGLFELNAKTKSLDLYYYTKNIKKCTCSEYLCFTQPTWYLISGGTGKPASGLLQGVSAVMSFGLIVLCATYSGNLIASLTGNFSLH